MRVAVILPYRAGCPHREAAYETVTAWWRLACPEFTVSTVDDGGDPFSRGGSLNKGIVDSDADVIVAADADLLISRSQIIDAVTAAATPGLVQPFTRLHWYAEKETRVLLEHPHRAFDRPPRAVYQWPVNEATPLLGGMNVLSRDTWERSGGWLPQFRGWGHEDVAFAAQCRTLVAPHRKIRGTVHHLFHPKPITTPYASPDTGVRNLALSAAVLAADGNPTAMRSLVDG